MPGFTDCSTCDFRDRPEVCHAMTSGHRRFCELIAQGRSDYRQLVWRESTGLTPPPELQTKEPISPPVFNEVVPLADQRAVLECPVRGAPRGCGCADDRLCGLSLAPVTHADCVRCVQTTTTTTTTTRSPAS